MLYQPAYINVSLGADSSPLTVVWLPAVVSNGFSPNLCLNHTAILKHTINPQTYQSFNPVKICCRSYTKKYFGSDYT